ncbi:MAG: hypothetical protein L0387_29885 [Acidobacteria bacterium]|nr:hypothetical protein [Acidobacteriota bacterium]MCI0625806.1 hypothetical protein [Acidobacteriota bacterium]MCI0721411.1 hypothetical protein [Acidobacteriota bacterium]
MPASVRRRRTPGLQELFGSEPGFEMTAPDRGSFHLGETTVNTIHDSRGWISVLAKLPSSVTSALTLATSLLEVHGSFKHPVKFAQAEAELSVDLMVDIPQCELGNLSVLNGALKSWMCEGVELFHQVRDGKGREDREARSALKPPPDADLATLDQAGQRMEQALNDSCLEWSAGEAPGSYSVSLDLDEYFQTIQIEIRHRQSLLFQSPLVGPSALSGDALKALAHFLLRANHRIRFARLSLQTDPAGGDQTADMSKKSVVAELAWPVALLPALSIEKAVASLIVAARLTRLEAEVLFDPGAAQVYLGMSGKERQQWEPQV